jgi:DNA repair exonuclease SbcCD nuclease subunit
VFRFLHAADIHLDSPLVGLDRYETAPVEAIRGATRRAFENLVHLAIEDEVAFVILAGDIYDGDWKDYRTGLFFVEQMVKLRDARIPVFMASGNHDADSHITKRLRLPDNVHLFSTRKPGTHRVDSVDVAIHGQGFSSRAVTENLSSAYPAADHGLFNIGVLHTSLDGREGHAVYAPTSAQLLAQKGYDYWALGHVHRREIVSTEPWIVFPGNTQGRHARELGPKGCTLVTVEDGGIARPEERILDVFRWVLCRVDVTGVTTTNDLLDHVSGALASEVDVSDGRPLAVRVVVTGPARCHDEIAAQSDRWTHEVRALAATLPGVDVWIEKVLFATTRVVDLAALATRDDAIGSFLRELASATNSPDEKAALRDALADVRSALPPELLAGSDAVDPHETTLLDQLIAEARDMVLARISRQESAR